MNLKMLYILVLPVAGTVSLSHALPHGHPNPLPAISYSHVPQDFNAQSSSQPMAQSRKVLDRAERITKRKKVFTTSLRTGVFIGVGIILVGTAMGYYIITR
ncbi:hypothetical protein DL98DRAFT_590996 [Cadophora sp. DSE1049]|nr:hypothetical protein DL98DRAFT_590996 [Cadophora sp. DSE1049]